MSVVLKTRQSIINNSNTAQENLYGFLSKMNKRSVDLDINESLSGNIDFSILQDEGFSFIKNIRFLKNGNITSIINLPKELEIEVPTEFETEDEIIDYISDEISNITGFCHMGFSTTKINL